MVRERRGRNWHEISEKASGLNVITILLGVRPGFKDLIRINGISCPKYRGNLFMWLTSIFKDGSALASLLAVMQAEVPPTLSR